MTDVSRVKSNVASMISQGAPESDIDAYLAGENVTPEQLRGASKPAETSGGSVLSGIRDAIHAPTRILGNAFLLGLGDRAGAAMDTAIGNGDYAGNLAKERSQTEQYKSDHPVAAPIIEGVGGVASPLGVLGAVGKATTLGGKALYGAGAGAGIGAGLGITGSEDWTNVPQTIRDAVMGAGTGAALGAAIPVAGAGIGAAYNGIANAFQKAPGISRGALPHLLDAYRADGAQNIEAQIQKLGDQAMLADAGPALLGKAQGASLNSDEGRSVLQTALKTRDLGTNSRIQADVEKALGPAEDPQTVTNSIKAFRSKTDEMSYPNVLANAPEVKVAPLLTRIEDMIPRSVGMEKKALTNLRDMMMTTERKPLLDSAGYPQYDNMGRQRWQEIPVSQNDAEVLHKVKQELDNVIQYDQPGLGIPAGALTRQQGTLKMMRGMLNNALETQVPGYKTANAVSAALAKRGEAVDAGTQYLGSGKTTPSPERFAAEFDPISQGEKIAFAKGSRGNIDRVLGTKANDLQALRSELQGEGGWNTAKMATVHGQDAADQLINSVDQNLKFRDTYGKVVENSQTAQRTAASKAMKPDPSSETPILNPNMTVTGAVGTMSKKALLALGNALLRNDKTKSYGEIAKILSAQGGTRDTYHNALINALMRREAAAVNAPLVGDTATLAALTAAHGYLRGRSNGPRNNN